jgi:hypothetical protein
MDLYTLDSNFLKTDVVDDFSSVIWTERNYRAGDVTLVTDASDKNMQMLAEGTRLALQGSKEVMILETQSIEHDVLTVTGSSLLAFLQHRALRHLVKQDERHWARSGRTPAQHMGDIITNLIINDPSHISGQDTGLLAVDAIPNLVLGAINAADDQVNVAIPYGSVYDALVNLAETYNVGQSLYLDHADSSGYQLKYTAYLGNFRTRDQRTTRIKGAVTNELVLFSPALDNLTNIKELSSMSGYKNVCYVFVPGNPLGDPIHPPGIAYAPGEEGVTGFDRRVLMVFAEDITTDQVGGDFTILYYLMVQRARNELANNNYTRMVDGEVVPQSQYEFGVDYFLGDIVELQGHKGYNQQAQITEYIRTQDESGEKAYPTVTVI